MARRGGIGATFQRENKKGKYTQKLTKKTKQEIKKRTWWPKSSGSSNRSNRSASAFNTGGGSRIGNPVRNKKLEEKKQAAKEALAAYQKKRKEASRKIAIDRFNSTLGGRAGQKTNRKEYKPTRYLGKDSDKGLTKREQGYKYNYRYSGQNNANQVGRGFQTALKAGTFSSKATEKEKRNVAKNIEQASVRAARAHNRRTVGNFI